MRHTYTQAKSAAKKLIQSFNYKKSDFYDTGEDIFCIAYQDSERPAFDILIEIKEIQKIEQEEKENQIIL
jgi:hypothetical protein